MTNPGLFAAAIVLAYLIGSIPFGLLLARMTTKTDIRLTGSGKTGATNVLRAAGKKVAAVSLLLDVGKGAAAVVFATWITGDATHFIPQAAAAGAAIIGHTWSVFLRFRGGRGVATFIGAIMPMYWPAAILGGGVVIGLGIQSRYMSLGSITGTVTAFIYMMLMNVLHVTVILPPPPIAYVVYAMAGAIFIYVMHRDNISRLVNGTERKIGEKPPPAVKPMPNSSTFK